MPASSAIAAPVKTSASELATASMRATIRHLRTTDRGRLQTAGLRPSSRRAGRALFRPARVRRRVASSSALADDEVDLRAAGKTGPSVTRLRDDTAPVQRGGEVLRDVASPTI
jgi:hypothetical protein